MPLQFGNVRLDDLFEVESGDFHATHELDPGEVPLISCGAVEDGLIGYFDIPPEQRHRNCITVAYNGSWPLLAKFHPYDFGAKDDVAVLIPRERMREPTLLYVATVLNLMTWRYSYYRKTFRARVRNTQIPIPMNGGKADEEAIEALAVPHAEAFTPERRTVGGEPPSGPSQWKRFSITDFFKVARGDFHSLADLDPGSYMTVSRVVTDNGVVGYFDRPEGAKVYPAGTITVSTLGGHAFVHMDEFIASDNVMILLPLEPMLLTTRLFVALMLNQQTWRYSYGRQCYRAKFLAADQRMIRAAVSLALETYVSGTPAEWYNPDSGSRGRVEPVRTFKISTGQWCREYVHAFEIHGWRELREIRRAIACRGADGVWKTRLQLGEES